MNLFFLQQMSCRNPTATILVELKKKYDLETIRGSLNNKPSDLMKRNVSDWE